MLADALPDAIVDDVLGAVRRRPAFAGVDDAFAGHLARAHRTGLARRRVGRPDRPPRAAGAGRSRPEILRRKPKTHRPMP